jgi:ribosomal-protein-alanine N-acetyltransferase
MNLEQGNILIRNICYDDLSKIKVIRDESLEYLDTQISFSLEEMQNWFKSYNPIWYVIEIQNEIIGYIRTSNYDNVNKNLYVGLDLHPDFRGFGYAFQSYQMFLDWLKVQGYLTTYLKVQISNYIAYNLYRKLGFLPIGIIPNSIIKQNKQIDSILMYKSL